MSRVSREVNITYFVAWSCVASASQGVCRLTTQCDILIVQKLDYVRATLGDHRKRLYAHSTAGKARWAHLSTSYHVVTSAEIRPSHRTIKFLNSVIVPNDAVCSTNINLYEYVGLSETAKSNWAVKRIHRESAKWADLTICLVVKP